MLMFRRTLVSDMYPIIRPRSASLHHGRTRIRVLCHAAPAAAVTTARFATQRPAVQQAYPDRRRVEPAHEPQPAAVCEPSGGVPLYVTVECAMHFANTR